MKLDSHLNCCNFDTVLAFHASFPHQPLYFCLTLFHLASDVPLTFTMPLKDTQVEESEDATFNCTLNKPDQTAAWSKDGQEVTADSHFVINSEDCSHMLTVKASSKDDEAEYTVKCGDVTSSAKLTVEGTHSV